MKVTFPFSVPAVNPLLDRTAVSSLGVRIGRTVLVMMKGGVVIRGSLRSFDDNLNLVLEDCYELETKEDGTVEETEMGTYLVRGDSYLFIGTTQREEEPELEPAATPEGEEDQE